MKTLKYPLPTIVVIVDVALSLSVKADASGHPGIQREHR